MKKIVSLCVGILTSLLLSLPVQALEVSVEQPWAWATPPGRTSANVYFLITSSEAARIVGATSPAAEKVILETMDHSGPRMKILTVDEVKLTAGKKHDMTSEHSYHLKLVNLVAPLKAGDSVPVTLQVVADKQASPESVAIQVQVKARDK